MSTRETWSKSTQPQKKCSHSVISTSHQPVHTPSPPQSAQALAKDTYMSPDRLHLHEALMCGGEIEFKVVKKCKTFVL
jgi:hypothetical protein